jgi:hypothetical protein
MNPLHQPLGMAEINEENLIDAVIYGPDDEENLRAFSTRPLGHVVKVVDVPVVRKGEHPVWEVRKV